MMPILVKDDDVRSRTKAKARNGQHGNQWVKYIYAYKTQLIKLNNSLRSKRSRTKRTKFWPRVLVCLPSGRAKNGARAKS